MAFSSRPPLPHEKAFSNFKLAKGDKALCQQHQQELNAVCLRDEVFDIKDFSVACSMCETPQNMNKYLAATFQASYKDKCCVISPKLLKILSETAPIVKPRLDMMSHVVEHELYDMESDGYGLKGLVYMKDQSVLAACSKNGSICFWSFAGEKVELKKPKLNLEKTINFAKYCLTFDERRYFAVGTNKGIYIYRIPGDISSLYLLAVIDVEKIASDLDFLQEDRKIVVVYKDTTAKIWSLDTRVMEKSIDLHQYDIKGEAKAVMYMKGTGELAIEHEQGLSIIKDWQLEKGSVRHHFVENKNDSGCKYLPDTKRFIMNNGIGGVEIFTEEDFAEVQKYDIPKKDLPAGKLNFPKKFVASQDESAIFSNFPLSSLGLFSIQLRECYLKHFFTENADLELIEDQYRIAIAKQNAGIVTIYRINANVNIERGEGWATLPAITSDEKSISEIENSASSDKNFSLLKTQSTMNIPPSPLPRKEPTNAETKAPKAAKRGKKIQKIELSPMKTTCLSNKKARKRVTKTESLKKSKKVEGNENIVEAGRTRGKRKTKEEKASIVLASEGEKKRGRSLKTKNKNEETKAGRTKRKADESEDPSRSRSKSKSITRKK